MVKNTINQYIILSGCITMLSLGFDLLVTPIYELFPRSGAVLVGLVVFLTYNRDRDIANGVVGAVKKVGRLHDLLENANSEWAKQVYRNTEAIMLVIGTAIWGYADLLPIYSSFE